MKKLMCVFSMCIVAGMAILPVSAIETENGITIDVGRVLHGARTGTRYYGFTGGTIMLPSKQGGILAFKLWNDVMLSGTSILNYFVTDIAGQTITIESYATRNQIVEPYVEEPAWGPAGIQQVRLMIPAGVDRIEYRHPGSETGVEISHLKFYPGLSLPSGSFAVDRERDAGEPIIEVGRVYTGNKTRTKFYGYSDGVIHLPHTMGGFLSFKFWNDQRNGQSWTLNKLNLAIGSRKEVLEQYTTSMDLDEFYQEEGQSWGPAGGGLVTIQIPPGIRRVSFNNNNSITGIELSDIQFTAGTPLVISFTPKKRSTERVLVDLGRVFTGKTTGRKYYGYYAGSIIVPDNKGGTLYFTLWNDHHVDSPLTTNTVIFKAGTVTQSFTNSATIKERIEQYTEDPGWGPSGGRTFSFQVPPGIGYIEVSQGKCDTGIELSDLRFVGNQ